MKIQQGDVILVVVRDIPPDATRVQPGTRGYVLAEGEATGHAHTIEAAPNVELYERDGVLYLRVLECPVPMRHEEHDTAILAPRTYRVKRVREWDEFAEEARTVID